MGLQDIDVTGQSAAATDAVWRLLSDSSTWPAWTPIDRYEPVRPGGPDGVGEIRVFRTGRRYVMREQVVTVQPGQRLGYTLLSGLAVRDYRADVDLTPGRHGGTTIRWHTTFRPKVPGTGGLYRRALRQATEAFVHGLAQAAERPHP